MFFRYRKLLMFRLAASHYKWKRSLRARWKAFRFYFGAKKLCNKRIMIRLSDTVPSHVKLQSQWSDVRRDLLLLPLPSVLRLMLQPLCLSKFLGSQHQP